MTTRHKTALFLTTVALGATLGAPAAAQVAPDRPAAPRPAAGNDLADIVVTARRVEERLQDVPISITVYNQKQLSNANIVSANDLALYTPSLTTLGILSRDNVQYAIRGFTQANRTTASVAVYFADVVAPRGGATIPAGDGAAPGQFVDLQSVQVLKGPQGTLFGRNTTGGAVLLVPQKPTGRFEGYVEGSYGNYDYKNFQGVLNVPLSDQARARIMVVHDDRDGYTKDIGTGKALDDRHYLSVRASLVIDLTPNLETYFIGSMLHSRNNGSSNIITVCDPNSFFGYFVCGSPDSNLQTQQARGPRVANTDLANPVSRYNQYGIINTTTWAASDTIKIKNIISYTELKNDLQTDLYGTAIKFPSTYPVQVAPGVFFPVPTGALAGVPLNTIDVYNAPGIHTNDQSTFTEELQLQGNTPDNRLTYQLGGYFEYDAPLGEGGNTATSLATCTDPGKLQCFDPIGALFSGLAGQSITIGGAATRLNTITYRNIGVYAQATYALTEQLKLTGGIRYTSDRTVGSASDISYTFPAPNVAVAKCVQPSAQLLSPNPRFPSDCRQTFKTSSSKPTWLIGLDYKPGDPVLLYAKYARGYRQGTVSASAAEGFQTFGPEKVDAYEAGAKTQFGFGDVRGIVNVAGFYNDLTNQQISTQFNFNNPAITPTDGIVNGGKSRIYGAEAEVTLVPFRGLTLNGSYTYLNTRLKSLVLPPSVPGPNGYTVSPSTVAGSELILSPHNKYTITGTYTLPLDDAVGQVSVGATYVHTDSQLVSVASPVGTIPGFNLLNLNLNWNHVGGSNFDASAFVTNVTNKLYVTYPGGIYTSLGFDVLRYGEPRMFGGRLRYSF